MRAETADVMAYFCQKYPFPTELSNARLTKMIYLADWEAAKQSGEQITPIKWHFNNYGPWVPDIADVARFNPNFRISSGENYYGSTKRTIGLVETARDAIHVSAAVAQILDRVIESTKGMYFAEFIRHVYSTEPVLASRRHESLDLVAAAAKVGAQFNPESAGMDPVAYADVREVVDLVLARHFLDEWWSELEYVRSSFLRLPSQFVVDTLNVNPSLGVEKRNDGGWDLTVRGTAQGSTFATASDAPQLEANGYELSVVSGDAYLASRGFLFDAQLTAHKQRDTGTWNVELGQVTLCAANAGPGRG